MRRPGYGHIFTNSWTQLLSLWVRAYFVHMTTRGAGMRSATLYACVFMLALPLGGCATVRGVPERVIPTSKAVALAAKYDAATTVPKFMDEEADRGGMDQRQYRDMVVLTNMSAIDARYGDFKAQLSSEGRGAGFGFDVAVLGLTTGAAIAKKTIASRLSAAAALFAGTKFSVDKNLYYEKALPAIIAAMDTARLKVKTRIAENLKKSAADYPLQSAFSDLSDLEITPSIDVAVGEVVAAATSTRQEAEEKYDLAREACSTGEDRVSGNGRIFRFVNSLIAGNKRAELDELATIAGVKDVTGSPEDVRARIRERLVSDICSNKELDAIIAAVKAAPWGSAI